MAASIEIRVPFLDHLLVEFAASLPRRLKLRGFTSKWILREALRSILAEWTSSRSYATRVANISNRTGQSADRVNGGYFFIEGLDSSANGTVKSADGAQDTLTGSGSTDWFFLATSDDITDAKTGETRDGA